MSHAPARRRSPSLWRWVAAGTTTLIAALGVGLNLAGSSASADPVGATDWAGTPAQVARAFQEANWRTIPQALEGLEPQPSLIFAKGTDYLEATRALYEWGRKGQLPPGTRLGPPLPLHIVASGETETRGLALSLTAAFGYDVDTTRVHPVMWTLPGSLSREEVLARLETARARGEGVPDGASIDPPPLAACQVENIPTVVAC